MRPTQLYQVPKVVMQDGKKLTPKEVIEKVKEGYELYKTGKTFIESVIAFFSSIFGSKKKEEPVYELRKVAR